MGVHFIPVPDFHLAMDYCEVVFESTEVRPTRRSSFWRPARGWLAVKALEFGWGDMIKDMVIPK